MTRGDGQTDGQGRGALTKETFMAELTNQSPHLDPRSVQLVSGSSKHYHDEHGRDEHLNGHGLEKSKFENNISPPLQRDLANTNTVTKTSHAQASGPTDLE